METIFKCLTNIEILSLFLTVIIIVLVSNIVSDITIKEVIKLTIYIFIILYVVLGLNNYYLINPYEDEIYYTGTIYEFRDKN